MKKMIYTTKATMLFFVGMTLSLFCSAQEYESFFGEQNTTFTQFFTYEWFNYIPDGGGSDIIGNGFTFNSYCSKEDTAWINDKLYYKTCNAVREIRHQSILSFVNIIYSRTGLVLLYINK